jgi:predicted nucleic acid-binding protein
VPALVLDASVALTWFLEDEADAKGVRETTLAAGAVVPASWPLEIANVLLVNERRGRITAHARGVAFETLNAFPIEIDAETVSHAWDATFDLAITHRLTLYDAAYLELAIRRSLPLASLDRLLREGATAAGIALLP